MAVSVVMHPALAGVLLRHPVSAHCRQWYFVCGWVDGLHWWKCLQTHYNQSKPRTASFTSE